MGMLILAKLRETTTVLGAMVGELGGGVSTSARLRLDCGPRMVRVDRAADVSGSWEASESGRSDAGVLGSFFTDLAWEVSEPLRP